MLAFSAKGLCRTSVQLGTDEFDAVIAQRIQFRKIMENHHEGDSLTRDYVHIRKILPFAIHHLVLDFRYAKPRQFITFQDITGKTPLRLNDPIVVAIEFTLNHNETHGFWRLIFHFAFNHKYLTNVGVFQEIRLSCIKNGDRGLFDGTTRSKFTALSF